MGVVSSHSYTISSLTYYYITHWYVFQIKM